MWNMDETNISTLNLEKIIEQYTHHHHNVSTTQRIVQGFVKYDVKLFWLNQCFHMLTLENKDYPIQPF